MAEPFTDLRKHNCERRAGLPESERARASAAVCARIAALEPFRAATHVAAYSAIRGEIDLSGLWKQAPEKQWYLPVIQRGPARRMQFMLYDPAATLAANWFGIPEPDLATAASIAPHDLDLVLLPLVGFDVRGHRVGMGAGYYDRAFAFVLDPHPPRRPALVGVGYDFQRVERIEARAWDVPLDAVVTEKAIYGKLAPQAEGD